MDIGMTLLGQAITFALLIAFTAKYIWPPLMAAIQERQQKIAEGLAAADRSKKDLAQAETRRSQIIDHAKEEAIEEGNRQKTAAAAEIVTSGNRAREDLRKQVSALAVAGAEKLILREIDGNAHKALLDELAAQI